MRPFTWREANDGFAEDNTRLRTQVESLTEECGKWKRQAIAADKNFSLAIDNEGRALLDQLHAYQSGVVEAVKALGLCETFCYADPQSAEGQIEFLAESVAPAVERALATLSPLVTMSAASRNARESESCGNVEIVVPTPPVTPKQ